MHNIDMKDDKPSARSDTKDAAHAVPPADKSISKRSQSTSRFSFWLLLISYPLLSIICISERLMEGSTSRFLIVDLYCIFAIYLAFDASLKIRRRTKNVKKRWSQAADAALDLMPTIFLIAAAQVMTRDMASMLIDPEFIRRFNYRPDRSVQHAIGWMGSIWTVLLAYTVKYHWDALISAFESDLNSSSDDINTQSFKAMRISRLFEKYILRSLYVAFLNRNVPMHQALGLLAHHSRLFNPAVGTWARKEILGYPTDIYPESDVPSYRQSYSAPEVWNSEKNAWEQPGYDFHDHEHVVFLHSPVADLEEFRNVSTTHLGPYYLMEWRRTLKTKTVTHFGRSIPTSNTTETKTAGTIRYSYDFYSLSLVLNEIREKALNYISERCDLIGYNIRQDSFPELRHRKRDKFLRVIFILFGSVSRVASLRFGYDVTPAGTGRSKG